MCCMASDDLLPSPKDLHATVNAVAYYTLLGLGEKPQPHLIRQETLSSTCFILIVAFVHLVFSLYPLALHILLDLREYLFHVRLISSNQRD